MMIELDVHDIERAALVAARMAMNAIRKGYKDVGDPTDDLTRFEQHFRGAKAELAVSNYTGLEWTAEFEDWTHDVGHLEVRSREWDDRQYLRINQKDLTKHTPAQQFVLCRVDGQYVEIIGWQTMATVQRRGRQHRWGGGLCWILEIDELYPPELLLT
jgi:hypothetical protein